MPLLKSSGGLKEGEVFVRWADNRIKRNKNLLSIQTGPTGSGKSYCDLRRAELLHEHFFGEEFPIDNVCFSVGELMRRISSGTLRAGEVLIFEEAGANAGSADWQNKIVKMFNYLLQTFRSMNVIVLMNLPVLSMLSKQGRQLCHCHHETIGIDKDKKMVRTKMLVHQLNQHSGKSYWKFMRIRYGTRVVPVKIMNWALPSERLVKLYEAKKEKFLLDLTGTFMQEIESIEREKLIKLQRQDLTTRQLEIVEKLREGKTPKEIAAEDGVTFQSIYSTIQSIEKRGYNVKSLGKEAIQMKNRA